MKTQKRAIACAILSVLLLAGTMAFRSRYEHTTSPVSQVPVAVVATRSLSQSAFVQKKRTAAAKLGQIVTNSYSRVRRAVNRLL